MKYNGLRAKQAVLLIGIILAIDVLLFFSHYFQYDLLLDLAAGIDVPDEQLDNNDYRQIFMGVLYTVVFIVSIVCYIRWFRRAYFNLHTKVGHLSHDEGWAAGAWFVPLLNWFRPYQIMQELYEETHYLLEKNNTGYDKKLNLTPVIIWWVLWVVTNIMSNIVSRVTQDAETIDSLIFASQLAMSSLVLELPLALLAIKVIKDYAEMEEYLLQLDDTAIVPTAQGKYGDYDDILDAPL